MSLSFTCLTLCAFALAMKVSISSAADSITTSADGRARNFIAAHEATIRPMEIAVNLAWWRANTTGKDEDFAAKEVAQNQLDTALSDSKRFADLKAIYESQVRDPLIARQISVLYLMYLEKQVPPELLRQITSKSNAIEKAFNIFRAKVRYRQMTDSEVRKVLSESKDSDQRKAVWESSKLVGPAVAADLKAVVLLRNQVARQLGFNNYHVLQLYLNEQNQADVLKLFDELDELTRGPFQAAKAEIDAKLADVYHIPVDRTAALALSRSVLPGSAECIRYESGCRFCRIREGGNRQTVRDVLCRNPPAGRRRAEAE